MIVERTKTQTRERIRIFVFELQVHLLDTQSVFSSRRVWTRVVSLKDELIQRIQTLKYVDDVFDLIYKICRRPLPFAIAPILERSKCGRILQIL